jgi:ectoine hydroxylase-related dioxygenase (phytanoyl-CoA dioxygenase family)
MLKTSELISSAGFSLFSEENKNAYHDSGFILVKSLFRREEIQKLKAFAEKGIRPEEVMVKSDQNGNLTKLKMWDKPNDDIYGMFSRNERVIDNMEILLGEPVYLYSAKMILKNARDGGAWEWHQDYGYWYNYGCLLPTMASCAIAIDNATKQNGCLQVLRNSQKVGRINHDRINEQTVADSERVEECVKRFELEHIEMDQGDALFFDGNILHASSSNESDFNRWSFIASYNTVSNRPYKKVREYGNYEPLIKVPYSAILDFV